jgi:energy-coupling factor transporter ATP-binding protein EcfA2
MKNIKLESKINVDEYTNYVCESFDIMDRDKSEVIIPFNFKRINTIEWNIGAIIGGSGSGKTSILKTFGEIQQPQFDNSKALISNFDWLTPKDATMLLTSMGLSSVPCWLRPFNTLSNGEQYRATMAYIIASAKQGDVILIDEFTSVVDRDVAKSMSYALQKYIRLHNIKIIIASCHYDILEWLMPNWVCNPQKGGVLEECDYLRQGRPEIQLSVSRVTSQTWDLFKTHHYMTSSVNKSCTFLLFEWNEKPVAIVAVIATPRNNNPNGKAISRVVVLPDYQGIGIGSKVCNFIGGIYRNENCDLYIKTVNPALGEYFNKSIGWVGTSHNGKMRNDLHLANEKSYKNRLERQSYCHKYVGQSITEYDHLLWGINSMRTKSQLKLF